MRGRATLGQDVGADHRDLVTGCVVGQARHRTPVAAYRVSSQVGEVLRHPMGAVRGGRPLFIGAC